MKLLKSLSLTLLLFAVAAHAHQQPMTKLMLDVQSDRISAELHLPLPELELAFGHDVCTRPSERIIVWKRDLRDYLLAHLRPATPTGEPWSVQLGEMRIERSEQSQSGPFEEVLVNLTLTPPPHSSPRTFTLNYDAILHQVVTHRALVSIRTDWDSGRLEPAQIGVIAVDTGSSRVNPLTISVGSSDWRAGFAAMLRLGMQHIREGTDHILFLIVLLLPATLIPGRRSWGGFAGTDSSLARLVRIVSAFTLGHSVTLLAGALHWLQLPQQPVEVLIACSILVTAVHAVYPLFPGREAQIAAGFGLVHGLAFATVLAGMQLSGFRLALSVLGFNLGIELMQLFILAMTLPWLILLSTTSAHRWFRLTGAFASAVVATAWIANRVSGVGNLLVTAMDRLTAFLPLGIVLLAALAIPSWLFSRLSQRNAISQLSKTQGATSNA